MKIDLLCFLFLYRTVPTPAASQPGKQPANNYLASQMPFLALPFLTYLIHALPRPTCPIRSPSTSLHFTSLHSVPLYSMPPPPFPHLFFCFSLFLLPEPPQTRRDCCIWIVRANFRIRPFELSKGGGAGGGKHTASNDD